MESEVIYAVLKQDNCHLNAVLGMVISLCPRLLCVLGVGDLHLCFA